MKTIVSFALGILISFAFSFACAAETKGTDPKTLFENRCAACHGIKKATSKNKTAGEWTETVMRMQGKRGASISDSEAKVIIDYLAKNYGK